MSALGSNIYRIGNNEMSFTLEDLNTVETVRNNRKVIEPWLGSIFQSEHLALLLGSGFTKAVANEAGVNSVDMSCDYSAFPEIVRGKLQSYSMNTAEAMGRGKDNIEDLIRSANLLARGLDIIGRLRFDNYPDDTGHINAQDIMDALNITLEKFLTQIYKTESNIKYALENDVLLTNCPSENIVKCIDKINSSNTLDPFVMLISFLLSFSNRASTRDRLHIFTTNYDRLIEYGADHAGIHLLDRFVGCIEPVFRASRLNVDMHYNPPGIHGEPRYLDGVVRFTKLHGSLDWIYNKGFVRKHSLPFGCEDYQQRSGSQLKNSVMVFPNSAKDRETSEYPYVELFRDFAASVCRPNSALVTYGYGFGDEHINRACADMLTIPSTHLVIISYGDEGERINRFCNLTRNKSQISLLIGPHFGNMKVLVENYLPNPVIDRIAITKAILLNKRGLGKQYITGNQDDEQ
jgi:hypothetical protein